MKSRGERWRVRLRDCEVGGIGREGSFPNGVNGAPRNGMMTGWWGPCVGMNQWWVRVVAHKPLKIR